MRAPSAWWERVFAGLASLLVGLILVPPLIDAKLPPPIHRAPPSVTVLAHDGALLRAFTDANGRWRLPVRLEEVDPRFVRLLLAYEDQRYFQHNGVDPRAALRAAWQAVRHRRIVSGASTITMQTVRLMTEDRRRTLPRKLVEALRAIQLERRLSKLRILTLYLDAAPYGGNLEGLRAASLTYYGREPRRLTLAQIALLIALPQSPEARRPDRHPERARLARNRVLDRLATRGHVSLRDAREAKREPIPTGRRPVPRLAPHLARSLVAEAPDRAVHATTLDAALQDSLEALASSRVDHIGPKVSAAILVAELDTGAVRAAVGSARFLDEARAGHVNMMRAVRSPGSTLKPFIYGLAMDAGLIAPGTLLQDRPVSFSGYAPRNFDDDFRGTVTAAQALRQSLNVPAVALLDAIGPVRLAVRLQEAGARIELPEGFAPTLALGLGGLGTTLWDLASLYGALASDGVPLALTTRPDEAAPSSRRLVSARAARSIAAILDGVRPPRNGRRGAIAYKTGTSYGHRDAFAVGFDGAHVVAVWVGRPDGAPVATLTGWTDAAPILFDAFERVGIVARGPQTMPLATEALPPPLRRFGDARRSAPGSPSIAIAFPPSGAVLSLPEPGAPLVARVEGEPAALWLLDGRPLALPANRRSAQIEVTVGHHTLTVVTADGASERVSFSVE